MPQDYDLNIDGKSYNLKWDKPVPPTQADIEGIVLQYRMQAKQPAPPATAPPVDTAASIAQGIAGGDQGAATPPLSFAPPVTDRKAIDKFRLDYFNTDNPTANRPKATAVALAANPNDYDALSRLSQMSPIAQSAIREHAQEIAAENARDAAYEKKMSDPNQAMAEGFQNLGSLGGFGNPVLTQAYRGQDVPGFNPAAAFKGPEAARQNKMTGHGKLDPSLNVLADFAAFAGTPQGAAAGLALGEIAALGTAGKAVAAITGTAMGEKDAYDRYKAGDIQGAITAAVLGAIPLVAEGMHVKSEVKATRKAAAAIPGITDIGEPGLTRGSTQTAAPETVSGLSGKVKVKRPFDVAPDVLNQISEHNANVDKEKMDAQSTGNGHAGSNEVVGGVQESPTGGDRKAERIAASELDNSRQGSAGATHNEGLLPDSQNKPQATDTSSKPSGLTPDQVTAAAKDGFTRAADLYKQAKQADPTLTREAFAQQLYEFHKEHAQDGGTHNYEGPSGNITSSSPETFIATTTDGRRVPYYGFSEKTSKPTIQGEANEQNPIRSKVLGDTNTLVSLNDNSTVVRTNGQDVLSTADKQTVSTPIARSTGRATIPEEASPSTSQLRGVQGTEATATEPNGRHPGNEPAGAAQSGNGDSTNGTKLANAHVLAERRVQGLPDFPTESTDSRAQAYEKAFANAAPETALKVAEEVRKSPRAMTLQELVDNSLKHREVKTDIADLTDQIKRGVEAGRDTSDLQAKYDSLVSDKHALTDASYLSGTDQSHAFAFRQHILEDYTPEDLQKRLEMARPEVAPTPKEVKAINDIADKHTEVEKAIDEHVAQTPDEADSQAAGQKIVEEIQAEQKRQSRRTQRATTKAELDTEFEDLKKQWVKKSTGQLNAGIPIDPESVRILRDMAKNRVKAGALTVSDVVDHLHEAVTQTLPDATKRQVRDWWTGYGQGSKIPGATTLGDLREQARWMSKIEDVNDPLPKSAPRAVSEAVAKLKEEYKAAKAGNESAKSPEEIEQARVEKRIESLKKTLAGNVEATPKLTTVDTEEMSGMRKELKGLQEDLAARKKSAGPEPPSPEQLTQTRMQRRIDLIEEKIQSGKVLPNPRPQLSTVDTESMAATRKQLKTAETRMKELQKAARPAVAKADPLEAYRTKLNEQIAEMQKQIDAGTPENIKKATVQKRTYDEQTTKLIEQRNRLRKQAEAIIESRKTKSRLEKFAQYHRFVILTRASTLGKLGAAATERLIFDPIEDVAGGALGVVPGYKRLADMAPNGRGSLKATGKAISTAFSRQAIREARQKLQTGLNSKDALHGDVRDHLEQPAIHNLPGRIHGAIKTPVQLAAYEKSIVKQSAWAERNGFDLNKPDVKAAVEARAYLESKRAILMQENTVTGVYRFVENGLEKNEKLGKSGKLMASALRTAFPIVAVPTNFVGEVGLHALGGFRAGWEIAAARGVQNLDHAQADIVVRSLKKQSVGAALFAIGYYNANNFGGYYAKGGNKHNDLETGSVKVNMFGADHEIPHVFLHSPQMEVMTMGAAFRQAMDNWRQGKSSETQIGDSAGSVAKGLAEQVPFVDMPQRFFRASESPKATSVFAGQTVGGALVPGLLPDVASGLDKDKRGRTKKRTPQGFMDAIKMSAGARQSVPEGRR